VRRSELIFSSKTSFIFEKSAVIATLTPATAPLICASALPAKTVIRKTKRPEARFGSRTTALWGKPKVLGFRFDAIWLADPGFCRLFG